MRRTRNRQTRFQGEGYMMNYVSPETRRSKNRKLTHLVASHWHCRLNILIDIPSENIWRDYFKDIVWKIPVCIWTPKHSKRSYSNFHCVGVLVLLGEKLYRDRKSAKIVNYWKVRSTKAWRRLLFWGGWIPAVFRAGDEKWRMKLLSFGEKWYLRRHKQPQ